MLDTKILMETYGDMRDVARLAEGQGEYSYARALYTLCEVLIAVVEDAGSTGEELSERVAQMIVDYNLPPDEDSSAEG